MQDWLQSLRHVIWGSLCCPGRTGSFRYKAEEREGPDLHCCSSENFTEFSSAVKPLTHPPIPHLECAFSTVLSHGPCFRPSLQETLPHTSCKKQKLSLRASSSKSTYSLPSFPPLQRILTEAFSVFLDSHPLSTTSVLPSSPFANGSLSLGSFPIGYAHGQQPSIFQTPL